MKTLEAQVPEILLDEVIELAEKQHTSVDQIVSLALTASLCLAQVSQFASAGGN